ncbi:alpha/beta fold hydrolase [Clostridium ihumii]|uniref:alpha/beta fold hydrolase n=1 Tax=Clostridium ihumii TaxID=1470356 RepID=UPI003D3562F5
MKKYFKKIVVNSLILLLSFIFLCYINNKIQLKKESTILQPIGKLVKINKKTIHVYAEGEGNLTCVFMSGLGNTASIIDMKPLYKNLANDYRIALVDKLGYGFSDTSSDTRNLDTIIFETRNALNLAGEKPPYVLFPHSISGIEAIYWAQKYPKEIKGIVGLDIGFPEAYVSEGIKTSEILLIKLESLLVKLGIHRLVPSITFNCNVLNSNLISDNDKKIYKALTYKNLLSNNVVNEFSSAISNSKKSLNLKLPTKTPICIFLAVPLTEKERIEKSNLISSRVDYYKNYLSKFEHSKLITSPGKHSIYLYTPEIIANESKKFLDEIYNIS